MRIVLASYVVVINIVGFILMGVDKRRAKKEKWRIPERTLILVAVFFGSVGILAGMFLFRHKTRKRRFSIGIPLILILQLLLLAFVSFQNFLPNNDSPSEVVEEELNRIKDLDEESITAFVSYENLINSNLPSDETDAGTADAVKEFFRDFSFSVGLETVTGDEAAVSVMISNIDAHALAKDLCSEIMRNSAAIFPDEVSATTGDYYELLLDTLRSKSYDTVVTSALFHLRRENNRWVILADEELEDELVGGFISYMDDPYLLTASEVLSIHLDALKDLSEKEWLEYLGISDLFATGNAKYADEIDEAYAAGLTKDFDYEIESCKETGPDALAQVRIKSIDMTAVLSEYRKDLLSYAASSESLGESEEALSDETSRLLLSALSDNTSTEETDIALSFSNDGTTWEVYFGPDFIDAVMGNIDEAVETFESLSDGN